MIKRFLYAVAALSLLFLLISYSEFTFAQDYCDPLLKISRNDPLHYQPRGTPPSRCEGRYIQEVSSTILLLASLTEFFEDYNPHLDENVYIEWTTPPEGENIHVRIQGIRSTRPRLFFRMDTEHPLGERIYAWDSGLLSPLNIGRQDIGVVGWAEFLLGNELQKVYIPLRIRQQVQAKKSGKYQIIIFPGVELSEVYVSLAKVEADGSIDSFLKSDFPLEYGPYPAEKGIAFTVPRLSEPGVYYVEVGQG